MHARPNFQYEQRQAVDYVVGTRGSHVDAPAHFVPGLRTVDQIDVREMILPLVVLDVHTQVTANPDYTVTLEDVRDWEARNGLIPAGAFVALRTDWSCRWPGSPTGPLVSMPPASPSTSGSCRSLTRWRGASWPGARTPHSARSPAICRPARTSTWMPSGAWRPRRRCGATWRLARIACSSTRSRLRSPRPHPRSWPRESTPCAWRRRSKGFSWPWPASSSGKAG